MKSLLCVALVVALSVVNVAYGSEGTAKPKPHPKPPKPRNR